MENTARKTDLDSQPYCVPQSYCVPQRYCVLIPARNEAEHIASVVQGVLKAVNNVVVVDDGSTDSTGKIIATLPVQVISQEHMGKGAALKAGFKYAMECGYDWVITIDGDGQHDWAEIAGFVNALQGNNTDMIIGTRMTDTKDMPLLRLLTNNIMSRVISAVSGQQIPDSQCGFRAISCDMLSKVTLDTDNYDTESELIIKASKNGFRITSIPVKTIYKDTPSGINKLTDTVRFLKLLLKSGLGK